MKHAYAYPDLEDAFYVAMPPEGGIARETESREGWIPPETLLISVYEHIPSMST